MNSDPMRVQDMVAEIDREVALRRRVYPGWIKGGKITQETADRRIAVLEATSAYLRLSVDTLDQANKIIKEARESRRQEGTTCAM